MILIHVHITIDDFVWRRLSIDKIAQEDAFFVLRTRSEFLEQRK